MCVGRRHIFAQDDSVLVGRGFEGDGLEHQRLGVEGTADGGLILHCAHAKGGEARRAGDAAGLHEEKDGGGGFGVGVQGVRGGLHDDGAELGDGLDERVGEGGGGFDAQELGVELGGALEVEAGGGLLALGGELGEKGFAVRGEEGFDGGGLGGVGGRALGRAGLVAGREALVHLTVDAAGMLRIRREVLGAAAELEEVEDRVAVAVGGGARGERAVGVGQRAAAEVVGGVDARVGVPGGEAEEEGRVQAQAAAGLGEAEDCGGGVVERERGLELGAGDGVVDAGDASAEVEALTLGVRRREDAGDAAAEVGCAGEVRLVFDTRAVQGEDSGERGDGAQSFGGALWREGDGVLEVEGRGHRRIVDWMNGILVYLIRSVL